MTSHALQFITQRRSIRKFSEAIVERELLVTALKAAMAAPSAHNSRPWNFLVVTEPETVRAMCSVHPHAAFGKTASVAILPFGQKEGNSWFDQDMAAATENLLLALANLGLGATWCGMTDELQVVVRDVVPLPEDLYFFALIPVGIPLEGKEPRTQYEGSRVCWESYTANS